MSAAVGGWRRRFLDRKGRERWREVEVANQCMLHFSSEAEGGKLPHKALLQVLSSPFESSMVSVAARMILHEDEAVGGVPPR